MSPVSELEARLMAVEAVLTAVLHTFYHLDGRETKVLFEQALENGARSLEAIGREQPKRMHEIKQALDIVEDIAELMKTRTSLPLARQ